MKTATKQLLQQSLENSATGGRHRVGSVPVTAMAGTLTKIIEDCPTTPEARDWEKIVDDIINWSDTVEGVFTESVACSHTVTSMV